MCSGWTPLSSSGRRPGIGSPEPQGVHLNGGYIGDYRDYRGLQGIIGDYRGL